MGIWYYPNMKKSIISLLVVGLAVVVQAKVFTSPDESVEVDVGLNKGQIKFPAPPENWDDPIDVPGLIKYAADKDVGILLYINDRAQVKYDFDETLATYKTDASNKTMSPGHPVINEKKIPC